MPAILGLPGKLPHLQPGDYPGSPSLPCAAAPPLPRGEKRDLVPAPPLPGRDSGHSRRVRAGIPPGGRSAYCTGRRFLLLPGSLADSLLPALAGLQLDSLALCPIAGGEACSSGEQQSPPPLV